MKLLVSEKGKNYLIEDKLKEFHTTDGKLDLKGVKPGQTLKTNKNIKYAVIKPSFLDQLLNLERGPQVILPKDAAAIVAYSGLNPSSNVVDAGSGSGWLACFLANIAKFVTSYEIRKDHHELAKKNAKALNIRNIKFKNEDVTKGIKEKNIDIITLDLLTPTKVPNISEALKLGGYCVAYVPHAKQAKEFMKFAKEQGLIVERALEMNEYTLLRDRIPHTGYLVFTRKVIL